MSETKNEINFEKALAELEQLVETMEKGDLTLEESLKQFERGVSLTRACQKALAEAEQKVRILTRDNESAELAEFEADSDNGA
ncbi:MAG: exodeoxyribonuclease VII small subunit [Gammaproteobacteria bacterium]|nr:exodeoxyribonuclease VII small subunit [Gammaproteobacteria bacterium]